MELSGLSCECTFTRLLVLHGVCHVYNVLYNMSCTTWLVQHVSYNMYCITCFVARELSEVHGVGEHPSYSGFVTVNATYDSNMFFWYFPAQVSLE